MKAISYKLFLIITVFLGFNFSITDNDSLLKKYNLHSRNNQKIYLPKELREISGIAYLNKNYLLTHNDEEGSVFIINILTGEVDSEISIGEKEIEKDFEGIAVANDSIYLVTSSGNLYKFALFNGKNVEYDKIKTPLSSRNNVEGLCYDQNANSLLVACKDYPGKDFKKQKAIYEYSLTRMKFLDEPRFLISLRELKKRFNINDFSPSGIEINPINSNIFLISANPEVILELDNEGSILHAEELDNKKHKQPEGIIFLPDGTLILADEANGRKAKLTIIPLKK